MMYRRRSRRRRFYSKKPAEGYPRAIGYAFVLRFGANLQAPYPTNIVGTIGANARPYTPT